MTVTLSENNNWKGKFTGLPLKKDGAAVTYSVEEEKTDVITGTDTDDTYAVEVSGNANKGFTITNTHTPETVTVSGTKTWNDKDNQDGIRPETITVYLYADNILQDSKSVGEADEWTYKWEDLPKYRDGKEIAYTVGEQAIEVSRGLTAELLRVSKLMRVDYFDASPYAEVSVLDAVHMTARGHIRLAEAMAEKIRTII